MARDRLAQFVVLCLVLFAASMLQADQLTFGDPRTLDSLINGTSGELRAGDKLFTDFSYTASGTAPAATDILVQAVEVDGKFGLHFTVVPTAEPANAGFSASGSGVADGALSFQVTADSPNMIDGVDLILDSPSVTGTGTAAIVENLFAQVPGQPLTAPMMASTATGALTASATLTPRSSVSVFKDVIVSGGGDGAASIASFYQTFDQMPEPATLSLLALGGIALCRRARR